MVKNLLNYCNDIVIVMVKNISIVMIKLVMVKNVPIIMIKLVTVRNIPIVMIICQRLFITINIELSENETIFACFIYVYT